METLLYLLYMAAGRAPMIPLDAALRPTWLFGATVHEGCDRGGYDEQVSLRTNMDRLSALLSWAAGAPWCSVMWGNVGGWRELAVVPM